MKHRSCFTEMMYLGGCFKPKIFENRKKVQKRNIKITKDNYQKYETIRSIV